MGINITNWISYNDEVYKLIYGVERVEKMKNTHKMN